MESIKRVNTTMPESLLRRVDLYSQLNLEDRATAIRQLVAEGLRVKLQESVLEQYRKRKVTLRQAAEMLGVSYWEMDNLLREYHIPLAADPSTLSPSKRRKRRVSTRTPRKAKT